MLNGIQFPANSPIDLAAWRSAVREGQCAIHMRGYSHNLLICWRIVASVSMLPNIIQKLKSHWEITGINEAFWENKCVFQTANARNKTPHPLQSDFTRLSLFKSNNSILSICPSHCPRSHELCPRHKSADLISNNFPAMKAAILSRRWKSSNK